MTNEATNLSLETLTKNSKQVWAVFYEKNGRKFQTNWTTFENEAKRWGQIIRAHGYCMSASEWPQMGSF
jgi:hypothetical protein